MRFAEKEFQGLFFSRKEPNQPRRKMNLAAISCIYYNCQETPGTIVAKTMIYLRKLQCKGVQFPAAGRGHGLHDQI